MSLATWLANRWLRRQQTVEYDYFGGASKQEAEELIAFGHELQAEVRAWLQKTHPVLAP